MAASPSRRSTRTWILSDSRTPTVTGQPPVYRSERSAYRAPTGTLCAKEGSRFCPGAHLPAPGLPQPGAQPPAPRRLLRTDLCLSELRVVPSPSPDPAPHRPKEPARRTPPPPRQSDPFTRDLTHNLLPEPTTESLCRHEPIQPHLSEQHSFHHCPRNTRHLKAARQAPERLRHSSFGGEDRGVLGECLGGVGGRDPQGTTEPAPMVYSTRRKTINDIAS